MPSGDDDTSKHIIVIGAGVSGLAAARTLLGDDLLGGIRKNYGPAKFSCCGDYRVTILEASNRVGNVYVCTVSDVVSITVHRSNGVRRAPAVYNHNHFVGAFNSLCS